MRRIFSLGLSHAHLLKVTWFYLSLWSLTSFNMAASARVSSYAAVGLDVRQVDIATNIVELTAISAAATKLLTDTRQPRPTPTQQLSDVFDFDPTKEMTDNMIVPVAPPRSSIIRGASASVLNIPLPTEDSSGGKTLPEDLAATPFREIPGSTSSASKDNVEHKGPDTSTIVAITLGVALFVTAMLIGAYCFYTRRNGRPHFKHKVRGGSGQWTVVKQGTPTTRGRRESLLPIHERRFSISRPIPETQSFNQVGHAALLYPQISSLSEPKPAFAAEGKPGHAYNFSLDSQMQTPNLDFATTEKFVRADRRVTVDISVPPPALRIEPKKRPTPPQLFIPGGSPLSATESITTTTIAGLTTSVYVPPTPSAGRFKEMSPATNNYLVPTQLQTVSGKLTPCDYFSPDEIQPCPSPPPKDRQRFSDPLTPTPVSTRSMRSLSWNGHALAARPQGPRPQEQVSHPEWLYTSAAGQRGDSSTGATPVDTAQQNWIPVDYERDSMTTHAQSMSSRMVPSSVYTSSHLSLATRTNDLDDDIISEGGESLIDSDYDSGIDSSDTDTSTPKRRLRPTSGASTRYSEDSVKYFSRLKPLISRESLVPPVPELKTTWKNAPRTLTSSADRLSSPGLLIVQKPGGESPPLSPVMFRIDNNPLTPNPLYAPQNPLRHKRSDDATSDSDSYPAEWQQQMERMAVENENLRGQKSINSPILRESTLIPPLKYPKRKSVTFANKNSLGASRSDSSDAPSTGATFQKIRPSWYITQSDGSKMEMI